MATPTPHFLKVRGFFIAHNMNRFFIIFTFLTIALLVAIIYSNSFNVPFQFDDVKRIVDIKAAQVLDFKEIFQYSKNRFLVYITLALNFYFGGHHVFGYHLLNVVVHIISSFLVFFLSSLILQSPKFSLFNFKKDSYLLSFFSALIFALHPIQTESVIYIWQRAESMAGMFYFLSLILYAKFRLTQIYNPDGKGKVSLYIACLASMTLCFFTKPTSATLPAAILIYEVFFLSNSVDDLKKCIKYLLPILIFIVLPVLLARHDIEEAKNVGIRLSTSYMPYYYTKLRVLANAFWLMFLPINQRIEYDFIWSSSLGEPISTFYSFIFSLFLISIAIFSFKRYPLVSFAICWFYLTLSVTTLLFLDDLFFEHYLYLPLFGFSLLLPVLSRDVLEKIRINRRWWIVFLIILLAVYSVATYKRNNVWQTEISLWEDAVKKSPRHARSNYTLGVYYFRAKRYKEAFESYKRALFYKPGYPEAYYRLGEYYLSLGDREKSIANYKKAIEAKPEFFEAHLNLGSLYLYSGRLKDAVKCFDNALKFTEDPVYIEKIENTLKEIRH